MGRIRMLKPVLILLFTRRRITQEIHVPDHVEDSTSKLRLPICQGPGKIARPVEMFRPEEDVP
jgi:hypothetical protein